MIEPFRVELFEDHVGQAFEVGGLPMTLERVERWGPEDEPAGTGGQQAFTLTWLGPLEPLLPQQIHQVEHPTSGSMEIFVVPVGATSEGVQYEAVFSP